MFEPVERIALRLYDFSLRLLHDINISVTFKHLVLCQPTELISELLRFMVFRAANPVPTIKRS